MYECILKNRHLDDLNPILFGEEACAPNHSYGPRVRDYVLIHFVTKGQGTYMLRGTKHHVEAGDAFIIRPGDITTYYADSKDPWVYQWIGFDGKLSERFCTLPPVVKYRTNWAKEIVQMGRDWSTLEYLVAGKLFSMYSEWFSKVKEKNDYVRTINDYISAKYGDDISVEDIAEQLNLDRRYLSRTYKKSTGISIQERIVIYRLNKAKALLKNGSSVRESAHLCGYDDVCNFSKMFKKYTGMSPGKWKNSEEAAKAPLVRRKN